MPMKTYLQVTWVLVFMVYFVGTLSAEAPTTIAEWEAAETVVAGAIHADVLGIDSRGRPT